MITLIIILALIAVVTLTSYSKRCKKEAAEHKAWMAEARAEKAARKASYPKASLPVDSVYNV